MKFRLSSTKGNSFQVSIGDDGVVVVYTQNGYAKNKLFIRSTEETETARLTQLLNSDPDAYVYLYIDTLDQSYIQKTIPGVGQLASNTLVKKRLDKEIPENHFKAFVQIGQTATGRKDYIYTFISAAIEPPISDWINYFLPFRNIINGIYFMPVELFSVVQKIREIAEEENQFKKAKKKKSFLDITKKLLGQKTSIEDARWELYLSQNKTGGFRQVAFQDGKIIFSRLINNINAPSAEIVAGNIEQEIANSIEYMMRLSLGGEKAVDVYLILSAEIIKHLRKEKIKSSNLFVYTPSQLSKKLIVPEASSENDKFADPTVLTYFSKIPFKTINLSTPVIKKVFFATTIIRYIGTLAMIATPALLIASIYFLDGIVDIQSSIKNIQAQAKNFTAQINEQDKKIDVVASRVKSSLQIDHVVEIVRVHDFLVKNSISPNSLILRLADIMPDYARIKTIRWKFNDPLLLANTGKKQSNILDTRTRDYRVSLDLEIVLKTQGTSFEELESKYAELKSILGSSFENFGVSVSDLPQNFTFQDINNPIALKARIVFPTDGDQSKSLPPAQQLFNYEAPARPSSGGVRNTNTTQPQSNPVSQPTSIPGGR